MLGLLLDSSEWHNGATAQGLNGLNDYELCTLRRTEEVARGLSGL